MQKTDCSVEDLVQMIQRGELKLPEMQRGYVWRGTRVRDLLDSLYRGYPSGNILVWETETELPLRDMAIGQEASPYQGFKLLLDGQQRLTSLSAILRGEPITVRNRRRPIEVLFNLDHPDSIEDTVEVDDDDTDLEGGDEDEDEDDSIEERAQKLSFVISSRRLAALPNWVSVTAVFKSDNDAPFLRKAGVTGFDDPRYEKYSLRLQRLRQIRKYMYSVQVLERGMSYNEVTEVFVRVNSLGAKLRSSDLALAQITARWRGALAVFEKFSEKCDDEDFKLETGTLVRGLVVHATGQSRFKTVAGISLDRLKTGWEDAAKGLEFAIHFARNNAGIESPALLSSPYAMLAVAYFAQTREYQLQDSDASALRFWLLVANGRGRYSRGSSETYLDQDLALIRSGRALPELLDNLRQQFGRLHFDVEEFKGRNQRASLFRLMFQALKAAGATDWRSGIQIAASSYGADHKLQFHHIFPKAVLNGRYTPAQINEIGNLAFISGKTNRGISAKPPSEYLPGVLEKQGEKSLTAQCVPTDPALWTLDRFPEFLAERHRLLSARVNDFLGAVPESFH
jgi:hypothetical protein